MSVRDSYRIRDGRPVLSDEELLDPVMSDPAMTDPAMSDRGMSDRAMHDPAKPDPAMTDPAKSHRGRAVRAKERGGNVIRVRIPGGPPGAAGPGSSPAAPLESTGPKGLTERNSSVNPPAPDSVPREAESRPMVKVLGVPVFSVPTASTVPESQPDQVEWAPVPKWRAVRPAPKAAPEAGGQTVCTSLVVARGSPPEPIEERPDRSALALVGRAPQNPSDNEKWVGPVQVLEHHEVDDTSLAIPLLNAAHSLEAEDYRVLSQRLRTTAPGTKLVALVAVSEERLTSEVAINLASALAEDAPDPVLVVDANFGHPMLSIVLGIPPIECFARQVRGLQGLGNADKVWVAMSVGFPHLHVLAIDPESSAATRRFDPPAFRSALSLLKQAPYRMILIDLPPVLRSSGYNLASDLVDGVILTAQSGVTRARQLKLAAERLAPVPVLGTVLFG